MGKNKLTGILLTVLIGVVVIILIANGSRETEIPKGKGENKSSTGGTPGNAPRLPTDPRGGKDTPDTTADTINTLTASVQTLRSQINSLKLPATASVQTGVSTANNNPGEFSDILLRLKGLEAKLERRVAEFGTPFSANAGGGGAPDFNAANYPVSDTGLGFENGAIEMMPSIAPGYVTNANDSHYVTAVPLYHTRHGTHALAGPAGTRGAIGSTDTGQAAGAGTVGVAGAQGTNTAYGTEAGTNDGLLDPFSPPAFSAESTATPYLTIPRNATLFNSTALTALIGRVPVGGSVVDPMPVKIIIGRDNLAANGHRIPGLDGMIFSGSAVGDWTLSCVTVNLNAASFVFEDGTIVDVGADRLAGSSQQSGGSFGTASGRSTTSGNLLAWVSDLQGVPCIRGERLTNAPQQVGIISLLGLTRGAADAYAQKQVTSSVSQGTSSSAVTGNSDAFVYGNAAASSVGEAASAIRARFSDSFDAIYVPPGQKLAIHIDRSISIDYQALNRKISHDSTPFDDQTQQAQLD